MISNITGQKLQDICSDNKCGIQTDFSFSQNLPYCIIGYLVGLEQQICSVLLTSELDWASLFDQGTTEIFPLVT